MWELRGQFSKRQMDSNTGKPATQGDLENSVLLVDTQEEAEAWWETRTRGRTATKRVSVMFDPQGKVVRVNFNQGLTGPATVC